jgi:hypothetical protein
MTPTYEDGARDASSKLLFPAPRPLRSDQHHRLAPKHVLCSWWWVRAGSASACWSAQELSGIKVDGGGTDIELRGNARVMALHLSAGGSLQVKTMIDRPLGVDDLVTLVGRSPQGDVLGGVACTSGRSDRPIATVATPSGREDKANRIVSLSSISARHEPCSRRAGRRRGRDRSPAGRVARSRTSELGPWFPVCCGPRRG